MDRLIATNSVPFANADIAPATGTPQYGTSGNPGTGTPATVFPAYAWNAIQDEIYNVIVGAGLTPNRNAWNQLLTAIQTLLQQGVSNVGIDTGVANAYVVAFTPALTAPVPWAPFWFEVKTTNIGASTLNATGTVEPLVGAAHLALQGNELVAKGNALVYWNPTLAAGAGSYVLIFCSGAPEQIAAATSSNQAMQLGQSGAIPSLTAAVASNALTATLNAPLNLFFRSATLASGVPTSLTIASNLSITVPSGATLGTSNGIAATLALLAINNGGTVQLGIVNIAGTASLDEGALISATAISGSATSANTIYSSSAVTNCPFRVIGFITATEATAGTWATAPTQVQGASVSLLGFGSAQGSSGYQKFPSGTIMQWGTYATNGSTGVSVTFPIAFPNAVRAVTVSANVPSSTVNGAYDSVNSLTATGFLVDGWQAGSTSRSGHSGNYIAFGN